MNMENQWIKIQNQSVCAWVDPTDGMNVCKVCYGKETVIDSNLNRKKMGATYGMPILFPTPGRTKDFQMLFQGKTYDAHMHGLVRKLPFQVEQQGETSVVGCLKWNEEQAEFYRYPFKLLLKIEIRIVEEQLQYSYNIRNEDVKPLGFGFALHPFFQNKQQNAALSISADYAMESDTDLIPTGKLMPIEETDLKTNRQVVDLNLDTVFYRTKSEMAVIQYQTYQIKISTTPDFQHVVIFTPKKADFFCVEPQTSSADCFRLFAEGLKEESGLQMVNPTDQKNGTVIFSFSRL